MKCQNIGAALPGGTLVSQLSELLPRGQQLTALPRHQPSFDCCQQVALDARRDLFQMATVVRLVETNKDVCRYRYVDVLCRKLLNIDMDSAYRYVTARKYSMASKTNPVRSVPQYCPMLHFNFITPYKARCSKLQLNTYFSRLDHHKRYYCR